MNFEPILETSLLARAEDLPILTSLQLFFREI